MYLDKRVLKKIHFAPYLEEILAECIISSLIIIVVTYFNFTINITATSQNKINKATHKNITAQHFVLNIGLFHMYSWYGILYTVFMHCKILLLISAKIWCNMNKLWVESIYESSIWLWTKITHHMPNPLNT